MQEVPNINRTRRAFTLIELLVVIAIIAILAAILFPVFAQAKEAAKKTQTLNNYKQVATSMIMYAGDNDDLFPLANATAAGGAILWNSAISIPQGWRPGTFSTEPRLSQDATHWSNSIQAYSKSYEIYEGAGMPKFRAAIADYGTPVRKWANSAVTFNGLLEAQGTSAIALPSRLSLVWQGQGKGNYEGFAISNPTLQCPTANSPCSFNPGGPTQSGGSSGSAWFGLYSSAWVYGKGMHFVATDTSAKFVKMGGTANGTTQNRSVNDPFAVYNTQGNPISIWNCALGSAPAYSCFFRPDSEFNYF